MEGGAPRRLSLELADIKGPTADVTAIDLNRHGIRVKITEMII